MIKFIIEGRKWFDKINGNTYHNVEITNASDNVKLYESGITYGYGEQWKETAMDWLIKHGLWLEKQRNDHKLLRYSIYFNVTEVSRKRDL